MSNGPTNSNAVMSLPDGSKVVQIGSTMGKFVEGFAGGAYAVGAPSITGLTGTGGQWDIARNIGAATITLNNGNLVLGMGTAINNEVLLVARANVTVPQNLIVSLMLSQRLAANEVRVGYVQVDPDTGIPVANPNLTGFFSNMASIMFTSTVTTTATAEAMEDAQAALKTAAITGLTATTTLQDYSLECRPEDVTYSAQLADSSGIRVATAPRISSVVPNANVVYRPFIWVRNVAAAATSTIVTVQRVVSMDIQEIQVEVGGGRGNNVASQSVPVYSLGGNIAVTGGTVNANITRMQWYSESTTALSASATLTGTSRDNGALINSTGLWNKQAARAYLDQAATLYLDQSQDAATWETVAVQTCTPTTPGTAQSFYTEAQFTMRYGRVRVVNGATLQGTTRITYATHCN